MLNFSHWLADTPASETVRNLLWIIPTLQTIHILAVAVVVSSVVMLNLRMLELTGRSQTMKQTAQRSLPWLWTSLVVLAVTGMTLIIGEPARELNNAAFWTKMVLLAIAIAVTFGFQFTLHRTAGFWEERPATRIRVRFFAAATFLLWCAIMVAGRWIAYVKVLDPASG